VTICELTRLNLINGALLLTAIICEPIRLVEWDTSSCGILVLTLVYTQYTLSTVPTKLWIGSHLRIEVRNREHNPPHVHAMAKGAEAAINLNSLMIEQHSGLQ
jgi:hypothetical protein